MWSLHTYGHQFLPLSPRTYLTVGTEVSGADAVTDVAVPALFAQACVATGGAAAPLLQFPGAETADPKRALDLSQTANITALSIDEEVAHAAYVAIVKQRRPDLWRQNEVRLRLGQPT